MAFKLNAAATALLVAFAVVRWTEPLDWVDWWRSLPDVWTEAAPLDMAAACSTACGAERVAKWSPSECTCVDPYSYRCP